MSREFELCPGRRVGGEQPCFIIAEIGQNHQGDLAIAKRMIRMAKVRPVGAGGRAGAAAGQGCPRSLTASCSAGSAAGLHRPRQAGRCG